VSMDVSGLGLARGLWVEPQQKEDTPWVECCSLPETGRLWVTGVVAFEACRDYAIDALHWMASWGGCIAKVGARSSSTRR